MNDDDFRDFGHASIEFIINYLRNIRERNVYPTTEPGSTIKKLPKNFPERPENWRDILNDLENIILPALTHWQSPHFHGYFPSSSSWASIIGELLIAGIGVLGFTWVSDTANYHQEFTHSSIEATEATWLRPSKKK